MQSTKTGLHSCCRPSVAGNVVNARSELAAVTYQTNVLGTKGPRKMTVLIPKLDPAGNKPLKLQPKNDREGMLARWGCSWPEPALGLLLATA